MTYIVLTLKLVLFTGALLLLLVAILKLTEGKLKGLSKGKYVKIIEKTALSKSSSIYLLKLGEEGAVILTNDKGAETIKELSKEEIEKIELEKEMSLLEINTKYNAGLEKLKDQGALVLKKVKGGRNE